MSIIKFLVGQKVEIISPCASCKMEHIREARVAKRVDTVVTVEPIDSNDPGVFDAITGEFRGTGEAYIKHPGDPFRNNEFTLNPPSLNPAHHSFGSEKFSSAEIGDKLFAAYHIMSDVPEGYLAEVEIVDLDHNFIYTREIHTEEIIVFWKGSGSAHDHMQGCYATLHFEDSKPNWPLR